MSTIPEPARTQFGWVSYPPGGRLGPRTQTGLQLVVIESGEAVITVDGVRRLLEAEQVCILAPGCRERFRFARDRKTVHTWCTMFFDEPNEVVARWAAGLPFSAPLTPALRELIALGLRSRWTAGHTDGAMLNALGRCAYYAFVEAVGASEAPSAALPEAVSRACEFMASHLDEPIAVDDLAQAGGISANQLTRLFKRYLKTTPSRYLWQMRTQQAVNLLQNTGLSVSEIAYRVGFTTPFHFSRLCKQFYGMSPKALRQQAWSASENPGRGSRTRSGRA